MCMEPGLMPMTEQRRKTKPEMVINPGVLCYGGLFESAEHRRRKRVNFGGYRV